MAVCWLICSQVNHVVVVMANYGALDENTSTLLSFFSNSDHSHSENPIILSVKLSWMLVTNDKVGS